MDNINFKKIWEDESLVQLEIEAISKYVEVFQNCYVDRATLQEAISKLKNYVSNYSNDIYIHFGEKNGNYTPVFSMKVLRCDIFGHVKIEVDFEIDDIDDRSHRCKFFVNIELSTIENIIDQFLKILN